MGEPIEDYEAEHGNDHLSMDNPPLERDQDEPDWEQLAADNARLRERVAELEAEAMKAEAERDAALARAEKAEGQYARLRSNEAAARELLQDSEARAARLREALEPFGHFPSGGRHIDLDQPVEVTTTTRDILRARAALADEAQEATSPPASETQSRKDRGGGSADHT